MNVKYYTQADLDKAVAKAVIKAVEKAEIESYCKGVEDTIQATLDFTANILGDKFGFSKEDIKKFSHHFNYLADSCIKEFVSIPEIHESVQEEQG